MTRLADLQGPAAIGGVASLGALFTGPPGVGLTGLVICGSLFFLAARADHSTTERERAAQLRPDPLPPIAPKLVPLEHRVLRQGPPPHDITPAAARRELRAFLRDRRNAKLRHELRTEFRMALATTEYDAHAAGETMTASQWLHRARGRLVRAGLLP